MTHEKFKLRHMDPDTEIMEHEVFFDYIPAIMELWVWNGYSGSSVVFDSNDVKNLTENELIELVFRNLKQPVDLKTQIKHSDNFVFVTYGVVEND